MEYTGIQRDVFKLYRVLLRAAYKHKRLQGDSQLIAVVKDRFREKAKSVRRTDFNKIEFCLRQGYKQVKLINMPGFSSASIVQPKSF